MAPRMAGHTERLWKSLAYAARYGNQRVPDLLAMPLSRLRSFTGAVSSIVEEEQKPRQ